MRAAEDFTRYLKKHGSRVEIEADGIQPWDSVRVLSGRAFITPVRYKNRVYVDGHYLPQGYLDGGHYLYIGTPENGIDVLTAGTKIKTMHDGRQFFVKRSEEFVVDEKCVYIWAIITPAGEEEP